MSDAKSPQNLSMDEILATIRRIIAEDEQSSGTAGSAASRSVPAPAPPAPGSADPVSPAPVSNERAGDAPHETAQAPTEAAGAGDVLELTDALNEDGSVRRLAPLATESDAAEPEAARTPPYAERAAWTTAVDANSTDMIHTETIPAASNPGTDRAIDPGTAPPAAPPFAATPFGAAPFGTDSERLVSEVAALAAATAFGRLASVPRARHEPPLVGGRPLDEIVCELLRPLLRTWLDEHLPAIVERLVQAEIAKISARSGPG